MRTLIEKRTLDGRYSAHCKTCWLPIYRLWIADEDPLGLCRFGGDNRTPCDMAMEQERGRIRFLKEMGLI